MSTAYEPKFCTDCKWYECGFFTPNRYAKCMHPRTQGTDYLATHELVSCITARSSGKCGEAGKLWEAA